MLFTGFVSCMYCMYICFLLFFSFCLLRENLICYGTIVRSFGLFFIFLFVVFLFTLTANKRL